MSETFEWFLGIDWGAEHELCVVNAHGQVHATRTVAHTAVAVHEAIQWLRAETGAAPSAIAVGIETPHGVLVDTLLEQDFAVFALNPKQLDRFRDRFTAAGAKDDGRDAHVLGDAVRTDRRAFRRVRPDDPVVIQLREVCRLRDELQEDEARLANRLRDQLYRVDAPWLTLSPAADEPWLWAVLKEASDPGTWAQLPRRRVIATLRAHRIRRFTADQVIERLRQPRLTVAAGVIEAVATRIAALVPQLLVVHEQRTTAERRIDRLLERLAAVGDAEGQPHEHRDVEILQSLPGVGRMVTATMLTEATGPLANRDYAPSARTPGRRPSRNGAGNAPSSSTCGTRARRGSVTRSITGRVSASNGTRPRARITTLCGRVGTVMRGRSAAWPTDGCASSSPC